MIYTIHAKTADDAAGDLTTKTNVIRTVNMKRKGIKTMLDNMKQLNEENLKDPVFIEFCKVIETLRTSPNIV